MYEVFVSYRRGNWDFAQSVSKELEARINGTVFIDKEIKVEDFEHALKKQVYDCKVFVLIVTELTFAPERISKPDDWVRQEIERALKLEKPITMVRRDAQPLPRPEELPESIREILSRQAVDIYGKYFEAGMDELANHVANISEGAIRARKAPKKPTQTASASTTSGTMNQVAAIASKDLSLKLTDVVILVVGILVGLITCAGAPPVGLLILGGVGYWFYRKFKS